MGAWAFEGRGAEVGLGMNEMSEINEMSDRTSIVLLPESMTEAHWTRVGKAVGALLNEDPRPIYRRVKATGFVAERVSSRQASAVMSALREAKIGALALASQKVLPQPRRFMVEGVSSTDETVHFACRNSTYSLPVKEMLHIHYGRLRVAGRRRRLTHGGRELRVEKELVLLDLFFKGGGAFRVDLFKVSFDDDPSLRQRLRDDATTAFLERLVTWAQAARRPILPAARPLLESLTHSSWRQAHLEDMKQFEMRGRWWFGLAANGQLPAQQILDDIAETVAQQVGRRRVSSSGLGLASDLPTPAPRGSALMEAGGGGAQVSLPVTEGKTVAMPKLRKTRVFQAPAASSYQEIMREASDFEVRGRLDLAAARYRQALMRRETFEARLSLIEALVDAEPFEAWRLCREVVARFPGPSKQLVSDYRGIHRENYDCHEFLTYRGLRRFLRIFRTPPVEPGEALKRFFQAHDLSNKLPDATKIGLLTAYGEALNLRFPDQHKALIGAYNGLDLFNRAFRFLGVGSDDEAFDLYMFNQDSGWRRFYGKTVVGLVAFGFDYLGHVFFYDARQNPDDPAIVRLDADSGELEPIADNFHEFLWIDMTDRDEDFLRPRLLREWQAREGSLAMNECLSFQTSPGLGGSRSVENLTTSDLGIRLHMAGQIASQAKQIPEGAAIHGVRIVNQEELLLKVFWEL